MTTKALEAHGIDHIYHVGFPLLPQAYEIFCLYAFGQKFPYDGYEDLAMEVTGLAGDLPLGLRVFGSYLRGMSKEEWIEALPRLRTSLDGDIEKVLRFSYEALCDNAKDLFLYIACLALATLKSVLHTVTWKSSMVLECWLIILSYL